ncbi:MAG: peptidoglycan-associated lipoprotein Pal [Rhodocyclaceae bacterium]|nr:peptidoglycan-associated lipoprotein Pal [Rhodocyclaceae bacterium]
MQRTLIALAVCGLLSACSSTPEKTAATPAPAPKAASAVANPVASAETEAQRIDRIVKILAGKSIYFDYDNYSVKPEYQDLLKQDFAALKSAPSLSIRLEGNADERGSTEYNLALGQKRAEAVRRALTLLGVPEARLEAISYGKEKPRTECHEEKCWAENRRVDLAAKKLDGSK